jgi:retron-type reverse transcriptase
MKRAGNLFDSICSFESLLFASRRARRGKRYKASTGNFEFNLEKELFRLERELRNQSYRPGEFREFYIYEPKPRKISAAPYRDRVVQHSLCGVIDPVFERSFIHDNYACRVGKGTHKAVERFQRYLRKFKYALKFDIRKYFPSIDHEILKAKIRRKIKCGKTLWLTDLFINGSNQQEKTDYYFPGDSLFTPVGRRKGIPIGNLTSQLFANLFLNDFDHLMKEKFSRSGYLRYMDDMTLFGNSKDELWEALDSAEEFLFKERLMLKHEKSMVYPAWIGIDYLGYKVYPDHRRLRHENIVRYRRRLERLRSDYASCAIGLEKVNSSVQSWIGHVKHADTWRLRETLFQSVAFQRDGALNGLSYSRRFVEQ